MLRMDGGCPPTAYRGVCQPGVRDPTGSTSLPSPPGSRPCRTGSPSRRRRRRPVRAQPVAPAASRPCPPRHPIRRGRRWPRLRPPGRMRWPQPDRSRCRGDQGPAAFQPTRSAVARLPMIGAGAHLPLGARAFLLLPGSGPGPSGESLLAVAAAAGVAPLLLQPLPKPFPLSVPTSASWTEPNVRHRILHSGGGAGAVEPNKGAKRVPFPPGTRGHTGSPRTRSAWGPAPVWSLGGRPCTILRGHAGTTGQEREGPAHRVGSTGSLIPRGTHLPAGAAPAGPDRPWLPPPPRSRASRRRSTPREAEPGRSPPW